MQGELGGSDVPKEKVQEALKAVYWGNVPLRNAVTYIKRGYSWKEAAQLEKQNGHLGPMSALHPMNSANVNQYNVNVGDTLTSIAQSRTGLTPSALAKLNGLQEDEPLKPGQTLLVPTQAKINEDAAAAEWMKRYGDSANKQSNNLETVKIDMDNPAKGSESYATLNNPPPNKRIELPNGNVYFTNEAGHVSEVIFQPRLIRMRRDGRQTAVGKEGLTTDVGGHIQACSLGGACDRVNLFPQNAHFNNSAYKKLENTLRNALEEGRQVGPVNVKFRRENPNNPRPDGLIVEYILDGKLTKVPFRNQHGG